MRLTYLAIPLTALLLAGCGDDEHDIDIHNEPVPAGTQDYNLPDEPAPMPNNPGTTGMPPATDTTTPPPATDGTGMGTEYGNDRGSVNDPATGTGTGTTQ